MAFDAAYQNVCKQASSWVLVAFFACVGVALRLRITWLVESGGFPFLGNSTDITPFRCDQNNSASPFFVQNILACFLIAVIRKYEDVLGAPLTTGLEVGFCGCLGDFATWMSYIAASLVEQKIRSACVVLGVTFSSCFCAHQFGDALAGSVRSSWSRCAINEWQKSACLWICRARRGGEMEDAADLEIQHGRARCQKDDGSREHCEFFCTIVCVVISVLFLALEILVDNIGYEHWITLAGAVGIIAAPVGALLRHCQCFGNYKCQYVPAFTLIANLQGCACVGLVESVLRPTDLDEVDNIEKILWAGVYFGFGGSASALALFIAELRGHEGTTPKLQRLSLKMLYAVMTVSGSLLVLVPTLANLGCS
jgi:fluoride ion exporter CrcB/FEX